MPPARAAPRLVERSCAGLKRTGLSPQALPQNLRLLSQLPPVDRKKPDKYWSAPRTQIAPCFLAGKSSMSGGLKLAAAFPGLGITHSRDQPPAAGWPPGVP